MQKNGTGSLGILLSMTHRFGNIFMNKELSALELSSGQHAYLLYITDNKGRTQEDLATHFNVDKGTIARTVAKLETAGFIVRSPDQFDKRSLRLYPTDKAKKIAPEIHSLISEWEGLLIEGMSPQETDSFYWLLQRATRNAQVAISRNISTG